jgi:hypothetical protein
VQQDRPGGRRRCDTDDLVDGPEADGEQHDDLDRGASDDLHGAGDHNAPARRW